MPAIIYRNDEGERIPSFSTIDRQWGIKTQPLIHWAWKKGDEGKSLYEKEEANVGSCAHAMVEADAKEKEFKADDWPVAHIEQAQVCFDNWTKWKGQHELVIVGSELSLVSERHQFGGTIDIVGMIDGAMSILDIKTGTAVYPDHILQIVAYARLWDENYPDHPIEAYHIVRTGKEIASFQHNYYKAGDLEPAWEAFKHLRALVDLEKEIKKLM